MILITIIILNDNSAVIFMSRWQYLLPSFVHIILFVLLSLEMNLRLYSHFFFHGSFYWVWVLVRPCVGFAWKCFCNSDIWANMQLAFLSYFFALFHINMWSCFLQALTVMLSRVTNQWNINKGRKSRKYRCANHKSSMIAIVKFQNWWELLGSKKEKGLNISSYIILHSERCNHCSEPLCKLSNLSHGSFLSHSFIPTVKISSNSVSPCLYTSTQVMKNLFLES